MSISYLEELTLKAYEAVGIPLSHMLRPQNFRLAKSLVRRLIASGFDPDDLIVAGMTDDEVHHIEQVSIALANMRQRYLRHA